MDLTNRMNRFEQQLVAHSLTLRRGRLETLQVNVGRKYNQTCRHCHVDAAPWRTEMMPAGVARRVGAWIREHRPPVVDITGGAPELSEHFRYFVETAREAGSHVMDRNNLTIIETEAFTWLPEYLAQHEVEVVASLPCYPAENVNAQRGDGVFAKIIAVLRKLNAVGYGTRLPLNLVDNPLGAKLPGPQAELEADYKAALQREFGIVFNQQMQMRNGQRLFLWDVTPASLANWEIQTGVHCLACTTGGGSSCTGAVARSASPTSIPTTKSGSNPRRFLRQRVRPTVEPATSTTARA